MAKLVKSHAAYRSLDLISQATGSPPVALVRATADLPLFDHVLESALMTPPAVGT